MNLNKLSSSFTKAALVGMLLLALAGGPGVAAADDCDEGPTEWITSAQDIDDDGKFEMWSAREVNTETSEVCEAHSGKADPIDM